jgi:hypothetical protein
MIEFNNSHHGYAISQACNVSYNSQMDQCISRADGDNLLGGVLYQAYTGASVNLHIAGFDPAWVIRDMIWVCFHYPFMQMKCHKIFGQVPASNLRALEFNRKLGFIEETRIKDVFPDGDLVVLSMKREDCKWLKLKPKTLKESDDGWR